MRITPNLAMRVTPRLLAGFPRQRYPYFQYQAWGAFWYKQDPKTNNRRMQAGFVSMVVLTIACNEYYSAKYLEHIPEFPVESVRRTYEFPELLRNKYRHLFAELDTDSKFVAPTDDIIAYGQGIAEGRVARQKKYAHDEHHDAGHH